MPKNNLEGKSEKITVMPPVKVSNLRWNADEARRGDVLTLTADVEGAAPNTKATVTIYEYDENGINDPITELETVVKDNKIELSWIYEYHEDTDEIPSQEELERYGRNYNPPEYFFTVKIGEAEFGKDRQ